MKTCWSQALPVVTPLCQIHLFAKPSFNIAVTFGPAIIHPTLSIGLGTQLANLDAM